jgi:hypothetical protein
VPAYSDPGKVQEGPDVWHAPDGERVLAAGEWALVRAGLGLAWDAVELARAAGTADATGLPVFDALQPGQQIALLAQVGAALSDPEVPAPPLTAATEGALAAVFALLRAWLEAELEGAVGGRDPAHVRGLLLGAVGQAAGRDGPLPEPTEADVPEWELLFEEVEARLFWDTDYELGDAFLDLPPDAGHEQLDQHGIDPDYFTAVPDDPDDEGLNAARRVLAGLTGRPISPNRP